MTQELQARGVGAASLTENIDTPAPTGTRTVHVFGALAEFERNLIREREAERPAGQRNSSPKTYSP